MASILLLEDDISLGETLAQRLQKKSYDINWCQDIASARSMLREKSFDLMIFDVNLPDGNSFDLVTELNIKDPIIFLTARNSAEDRLLGFELGAKDYVPKPFHLKELFIRIEQTLGNHEIKSMLLIDLPELKINANAMTLTLRDGHVYHPAKRDFEVLLYLIEKSPNVIAREELLNTFWGEDSYPTNRTVDNTILRLRQYLGKENTYIKSVRGIGYQWIKEERNL